MLKNDGSLINILNNIDYAREISKINQSVHTVIVVSGNELDKHTWQKRLSKTSSYLFNKDNSTRILSFQEKIGKKRKEGNFLGTLLAYIKLNEIAKKEKFQFKDFVTLIGMLFGRGERMSPFTQIEGDLKPAIVVSSQSIGSGTYLTAIEEALFYFVPVVNYLERRGFRGFLDKWGDETEIASIDLSKTPETGKEFSQYDVIKCVSLVNITEELAKQKDWVISDDDDNVSAILPRNEKSILISQLKQLGIKPHKNGGYYAGVSLGPIAVSYDVLDIAVEVFDNEIYRQGINIDFDPYFVMALSINNKNLHVWEEAEKTDKGLINLLSKVPDFYLKVQRIKEIFKDRYNRKLRFKVINLGNAVFWADIGQHRTMREKYMSLNENSERGKIAQKLENIEIKRDTCGNIIINSHINNKIRVKNSIIINSSLTGEGSIEKSIIKDSRINNPVFNNAFCVLSVRPLGKTYLEKNSGLYRSIGNRDLILKEGMRHGTVITKTKVFDMTISELTNLRDREHTYTVPIFNNETSFSEVYDEMFGVSEEELEKRRNDLIHNLFHGKDSC